VITALALAGPSGDQTRPPPALLDLEQEVGAGKKLGGFRRANASLVDDENPGVEVLDRDYHLPLEVLF
jgi:hypothetical protein